MAEIEFDTQTQAATITPAAGAVTFAFDSANNGAPFIKRSDGSFATFSTTSPLADRTAQLVYVATDYGISPSNTGAVNVTAFNALYSSLPLAATIYFPPGTYDFATELTLNRDIRLRMYGAGRGRTTLRTTSATANLFNITVNGFYQTFEEMGLSSSVTKTAGALIVTNSAAGNNAYLDVRRCEFSGYFFGVDFQGAGPFNLGTMSECQFNAPSAGGTGIRINSQGTNAMLTNVTINQNPGATGTGVCLDVVQSGALQFVGCDFIGGATTCRITPGSGQIVAACYFTNCFFDQAGSVTVDIGGAGSVSRTKFVQCGITNGQVNNSIALRIAGTGTGTAIPTGIDFLDCDFYNAFAGTTGTTGLLLTGYRDVSVSGCRIAGFAVGVDITPYSANGISSFNLLENRIGPTENFAANGIGVRINAGAVQFAASSIVNNDLSGNTTPLSQGGTFANGQLQVLANQGLPMQAQGSGASQALPATTITLAGAAPISIPANSLRAGQMYRIRATVTNTATAQNTTITLRYGTTGTSADAAVQTATATGTLAAGAAVVTAELYVKSATQVMARIQIEQAAATGFNNAAVANVVTLAPVTIANTANSFLGLYMAAVTANIVTIQTVHNEVVAQ